LTVAARGRRITEIYREIREGYGLGGADDRLVPILIVLPLLFLAVFIFFLHRLEHSLAFLDLTPLPGEKFFNSDCILGTDFGRYSHGLFSGGYTAFHLDRHPLAVLLTALLSEPLVALGTERPRAVIISLAFWTALSSTFFSLFLLRQRVRLAVSALAPLVILTSFGAISTLSVVETYGVSLLGISIALLVAAEVSPLSARYPWLAASGSGLAAGMFAGWGHLPAAVFVLFFSGLAWNRIAESFPRRVTLAVLVPAAIALAVSVLPMALLGLLRSGNPLLEPTEMVARYADASNLTNMDIAADYIVGFLLFSWVSPGDSVQCAYHAGRLADVASSPLRLAVAILIATLIVSSIVSGVVSREKRSVVAAYVVIVLIFFAFYLYFNPREVLLYSSHWIAALVLGSVVVLKYKSWLLPVLLALFILFSAVNTGPHFNDASFDPARCCPDACPPVVPLS
jgi:hypothetical protein